MSESYGLVGEIRLILGDIFQLPLEDIPPDIAFGDLPQWDSMGHMEVMMHLEDKFGVEITADTIGELVNIPAICAYLGNHPHSRG